jgi:hypothetical protein
MGEAVPLPSPDYQIDPASVSNHARHTNPNNERQARELRRSFVKPPRHRARARAFAVPDQGLPHCACPSTVRHDELEASGFCRGRSSQFEGLRQPIGLTDLQATTASWGLPATTSFVVRAGNDRLEGGPGNETLVSGVGWQPRNRPSWAREAGSKGRFSR